MIKTVQYLSKEQIETSRHMTTEHILDFLENFREMHISMQAPPKKSKLISMKVKEPLLDAFKAKAKVVGQPYQTLIKQLMQDYLYQNND